MALAAILAAGGFGVSLYLSFVEAEKERWGRAMLWLAFLIVNAVLFGTSMEGILT